MKTSIAGALAVSVAAMKMMSLGHIRYTWIRYTWIRGHLLGFLIAAASWPYYFAAWNPDRTLAAISVSGQWPFFRSPVFVPDIWGDRTIDFVPSLESMGEYEAAHTYTWSDEGLRERQQHPLMPLSMLAGDTLRLTAIPPRSRFPVKVTVVAWQRGHTAEPLLKTAEPVERTFSVVR